MHWGINPPLKHHPLFLAKPPFLGNPPLYILVFREPPPLKVEFFNEPQNIKVFHPQYIPSYLLKVTKFIGKISQFEFLLMTEKNIFTD